MTPLAILTFARSHWKLIGGAMAVLVRLQVAKNVFGDDELLRGKRTYLGHLLNKVLVLRLNHAVALPVVICGIMERFFARISRLSIQFIAERFELNGPLAQAADFTPGVQKRWKLHSARNLPC